MYAIDTGRLKKFCQVVRKFPAALCRKLTAGWSTTTSRRLRFREYRLYEPSGRTMTFMLVIVPDTPALRTMIVPSSFLRVAILSPLYTKSSCCTRTRTIFASAGETIETYHPAAKANEDQATYHAQQKKHENSDFHNTIPIKTRR